MKTSLTAWLRRPLALPAPRPSMSANEALDWLTPDLLTTLGNLDGAPPPVAQAVAQLLPFGSRVALEDLGVIVRGDCVDQHGRCRLEFTPFGYQVVAAAGARAEADPGGVADWVERWDRAVRNNGLTQRQ